MFCGGADRAWVKHPLLTIFGIEKAFAEALILDLKYILDQY
jgi:hypothetical protein